jgi:type II secretory pathway pseudopilin PulG
MLFLWEKSMSAPNEKSSFNGPIFSRKKSLLTMQQYAADQGVSAGVVQECAKLGVVQVRKHKDKTFVVDLPLDAYKNLSQLTNDPKPEPIDTLAPAQKITGLINKILQPPRNANPLPAKTDQQDNISAVPGLNLFAQEENCSATGRIGESDTELSYFKTPASRKVMDAVKAASAWKIVSVIVTVAMLISIVAYSKVSADRKVQQQKLQQAYEDIQRIMKEYKDTAQKAKMYEVDVANWQSEAVKNQSAVADMQRELLLTKDKLFQAQKDLTATQQYNMNTLKQLNDQINDITSRVGQGGTGGK